ncbi:MAG TPA: UbiD family decarboxylase [Pirellulales bacterium]
MGYRTLQECLDDLAATGRLVRIDEPVDPHLEVAEIQRRVCQAGGPAVYYARPKGCDFPLVSNLFGTLDRVRFLFRDTLDDVMRLMRLKADPGELLRRPAHWPGAARSAWHALPRRVRRGPVLAHEIPLSKLPKVQSWPDDGGPFITLPLVYTEHPRRPGWRHSNLGMYRVQLAGNEYQPEREVGLHYQIHRGIGVHHAAAIEAGKPLRVSVFVGGPPAMTLAAVMPLPEGLPEIVFAGVLGGRRVPLIAQADAPAIYADADFCLTGYIAPDRVLPEGPFGDHLGYYSLRHDFPVLVVEHVYHRAGAVWPFTVVGRPPQEDTAFGQFIHELTGPVIPTVVPGVQAVHAVDAAGVHPLLLAIGSERYAPYAPRRQPQELLTQANALLGQGQMSLAKYLLIVAREDQPRLDIHDIAAFLRHLLARVDWTRDLHFQTRTTIDTLDYSGDGFNEGSKLVIAAAGPARRELPVELPSDLALPDGFSSPRIVLPGIVAITAPAYTASGDAALDRFVRSCDEHQPLNRFPLVVLVDDSGFAAQSLPNFLWVAFTRSNPAADIDGIGAFTHQKHWGCRGSLVIDARLKPHHAPPLVPDAEVTRRVEALAAPGKPLHGVF